MAFTRAQYRTRTQRRMDASSATRWDTTVGSAGEIDQVLGLVFDREWKNILNANRFYRVLKTTPTSNSSGEYTLTDLNGSGTNDNAVRFYRILAVKIDGVMYREGNPQHYFGIAEEGGNTLPHRVWYRQGDLMVALPTQASKQADGVCVNHLPCRIDNLSGEGVNVTFPDGYEDIICLEAAALLLSKGGAETDTSAEFKQLAASMRRDMLDDVCRISTHPIVMQYDDNAIDWAG
jgi:hypothetical protein